MKFNPSSYLSVLRKATKRPGPRPGAELVPVKKTGIPTTIHRMTYSPEQVTEEDVKDPSVLHRPRGSGVQWIDVAGLEDIATLEKVAAAFHLHSLVLEDIVHTNQRPKFERYDDIIYIVARMLTIDPKTSEIAEEQVSIVHGKGFVILFQENPGDIFEDLRNRIRANVGRARMSGADYLVYSLLSTLVDSFYDILEEIGEQTEFFEEKIIAEPNRNVIGGIHDLKQQIIVLRRSIWPIREVVLRLLDEDPGLFHKETRFFLRDVGDHAIQAVDTVETYRDLLSGLTDLYVSSISNRTNEVMKVLTIIATIFIPLTFIVGLYGMNFRYMPELEQRWGYPAILILMFIIAMGMLGYFKRKRWF
ncbi:MAG: magnesium/cobalt transporter CorA [Patescibacteria group bacterium]|jgi:magnesium transporter